jgi:hypothetical protein
MFSQGYVEKFIGKIVLIKIVTSQSESPLASYLSGVVDSVHLINGGEELVLVLKPWKDSEKLPQYIRERLTSDAVPVTTHVLLGLVVYIADLLDNNEIEIF